MKKILFVFIIFSFLSCKKNISICYRCTFGTINGIQPPAQDYCGSDGTSHIFTDSQGNNLQSTCVKK